MYRSFKVQWFETKIIKYWGVSEWSNAENLVSGGKIYNHECESIPYVNDHQIHYALLDPLYKTLRYNKHNII